MKQVIVKFVRDSTNSFGTITYHLSRDTARRGFIDPETILNGITHISLGCREIIIKFAITEGKLKLQYTYLSLLNKGEL